MCNTVLPFSFTSLVYTLAIEHFGVTLAVLVLLLVGCSILAVKRQESRGEISVVFLLVILFLSSLVFAVVSVKDDYNCSQPVSSESSPHDIIYDYDAHGERIDVYECCRD